MPTTQPTTHMPRTAPGERVSTAEPARRRSGGPARRPLTGMLLVAPTTVIVAALFVVPLGILLYMSVSDWPLLGSPTPNGVANYRQITKDDQFLHAITFTLVYTVITTVVLFAVAFVLVAI